MFIDKTIKLLETDAYRTLPARPGTFGNEVQKVPSLLDEIHFLVPVERPRVIIDVTVLPWREAHEYIYSEA